MMNHHQFQPQTKSFEVKYLGAAMLSQMATGLGTLQKPLKDLYCAFQRPTGPVPLNSNLLTVTDQGLVVSQLMAGPMGSVTKGAEVFYAMPFIQLWDVVQFVVVKEKDKKFKCAFEPLDFDQSRPRDNLFSVLDYKKEKHLTTVPHPVLFAIVLRRTSGIKALDLHAFVCASDQQAFDMSRSLSVAHAALAQEQRNETGVFDHSHFNESESILFNGGQPLQDSGMAGGRLPPSKPLFQQHPVGVQDPMQANKNAFVSNMYNGKANTPKIVEPVYGNGGMVGDMGGRMGFELSQNDFRKDPRDQQVYGGFPVYGNNLAPNGLPQNKPMSRSQNNIYQTREEVLLDQPRHLQRHAIDDIYGNNIAASRSLERPDVNHHQGGGVNHLQGGGVNHLQGGGVNHLQGGGIYGNFPREGVYGSGPVQQNNGIYGGAMLNMAKKPEEPQIKPNEFGEPAYGFVTRTDVNPVSQRPNEHIYGNNAVVAPKPNNFPPANFGAGGQANFNRQFNDDPPTRHPGTSPSYRRKFPGVDLGKTNWDQPAPVPVQPKPTAQPVSNNAFNVYSNQKSNFVSDIEYKPAPVPVQNPPPREMPAFQPKPPPAPEKEEPVPPGGRKSLFGIFPRDAEKAAKAAEPAKYNPPVVQPQPAPYITSGGGDRDRQYSGGDQGERRPIALVQPRKVTGIRVLPFGADDVYGKIPAKQEVSASNDADRSRMYPAKPTVSNVLDDPSQPTKDKEIASMFGNLNVNHSNNTPQSKMNFETSLGYLP